MGKTSFLVGFAVGYVLGSKAGQERYEQIMSAARSMAGNPKVQDTANTLQHQAAGAFATTRDRVAERVGERFPKARREPSATPTATPGAAGEMP